LVIDSGVLEDHALDDVRHVLATVRSHLQIRVDLVVESSMHCAAAST
jgi:hypothetical protein